MPDTSLTPQDPSLVDADDVAALLRTEVRNGLDEAEAARRLAADGPNVLREKEPVPLWRRLLAQFQDPLVYLLLAATAILLIAWWSEGADGMPVDAVVIAIIVIANGLLGFLQEKRAENAVNALARMTEATSAVMRGGTVRRLPNAELVVGDVLVLGEGDAIGADSRVVEATALRVQESSLTGESEAVGKHPARLEETTALGDRRNMVFGGTAVVHGSGRAIVTATGMASEIGAIAAMLDATEEERTPLQKEVDGIGRMLGIAVIAISVIVIVTVLLTTGARTAEDFVAVLLLGVSLAVAAVPEGLPAILTVVLALGVQRMARRNAVVKRLSSVETLGSASVICSDKTGTLTRSEMTLQRLYTLTGHAEVTGVGYGAGGSVLSGGSDLGGAQLAESIVVLSGGSLASNAALVDREGGGWDVHGDPTELAFLVAERKLGVHQRRARRFTRVREIPFSSDRKMMSTIEIDHERGSEVVIISKGAPDVLLERCTRVRDGLDVRPLVDDMRAEILNGVDELSDDAMRTLAVAYRPLLADETEGSDDALEQDLIYAGTVGILDPPREEARDAITEAHRAGIRVVMITGDHPRTAARIAADLGISARGAKVLSGAEIDALDDRQLQGALESTSVFARVAPAHKLRLVDALKAGGHVVAMTGDGVNDAPALKSADIGIAMGIAGTEVAKQAANTILADDNFATIVHAVREGRVIFDNIRKFLRYLLSSNMGEVLTVFVGTIAARALGLIESGTVVLPLLATQILWVNLVTDAAPALAIGVDPATDDVMGRAPRRIGERVIDRQMWIGVVEVGFVMSIATLITIDRYFPGGMFGGSSSLDTARTAGFTVLVGAQVFNAFNARSETVSAFKHFFANRWLLGSVLLGMLLQVAVVHLPALNKAFGTAPLSASQWLFCIVMSSAVLWVRELHKLVARWRSRR